MGSVDDVACRSMGAGAAPESRARRAVIRCLGAFEVEVDGAPVQSWRSSKARAVLAYLANHRSGPIPRDTLVQALWPDPEALAAGSSLKVAVHALRQALAGTAGDATPALAVVVQEAGYQLVAPELDLDVEEFERCCTLGAQIEVRGRLDEALPLYERATELYRGDFLADSWDEWVIFRREALKDEYLFVLGRLADAMLRAGEYHRCIQLCGKLLAQDCCREDTYRLLMICHARVGHRGRVRRWYELCLQTLRTVLDAEPEPQTYEVYEWARRGAVQSSPLAPMGLTTG
jgi:DNA-binding SARP family transcriptional activator